MKRVMTYAAEHVWAVLLALGIISLLSAGQLSQLQIMVTADSMLEKGTPAWEYFVSTEKTFGAEDTTVIVLRDAEIFNRDKLLQVRAALAEIEKLPKVTRTSSLFSTRNLRNVEDTIHLRPYLESLPQTPAEVETLRAEAVRNPLVLGNLISADGQTMAINVFLQRPLSDPHFDRVMTEAIEQAIAPLRAHIESVYQVGAAAMRSDLGNRIRADQRVFLPLSILVLLLTLALTLRRATAVLMPLLTAGISVLWTLGLMGWLGIPLNIMTSIVPALVIIIGSTEDIHLLAEHAAGLRKGLDRRGAIAHMADNMGTAVLLTFVTTYLGFLSIALNQIELLYQFGLVASTGLFFNFIVTVTLAPVMLRSIGHQGPAMNHPQRQASHWFEHWALRWLGAVQRHRGWVLIGTGVLFVAALGAATQLRINHNLLDYLDQDSGLRSNLDRVHRQLSGVHSFSIIVDSGIDNTFHQVRYLEEVQKIQGFLEDSGEFDRSFSFADFIALVNTLMEGEGEGGSHQLWLPGSDDLVREYLLFIRHRDIAGLVSENFDKARILVRHNISSSEALNQAIGKLRTYIDTHIDSGLRVEITGKSVLSNDAVRQMAQGQLQSLLLVGWVIVALVSILFVSLRAGLIALLPNLLPVAVLFAVMALTGIPLDAGTSMVAAIALGICVDDTMHVMSRFHEELRRHESRQEALVAMITAEATPIFATSLALAAGFAVFATSSFQPVVNFGLLSAMVILIALAATFTLTPLLLGSGELLTVWDMLSYKVQKEALQRSPLFRGMSVWQIKKILLSSEIRPFAAQDFIVREGDPGSEMFVVLEGQVQAQKHDLDGGIRYLRKMEVGDPFGEIGPLAGGRRVADVVALTDTQVLVLGWRHIEQLTRRHPLLAFRLFRNFTRIIGERFAHTPGE